MSEKTPDELMEDWYQRLVNVAIPLKKRGLGLACHPNDYSFMHDMIERLVEDDRWGWEEPMVLVVHKDVTPGTFQPVADADKTARILTLQQAMKSNTGLGRWRGVTLPQSGEITDPFGYRNGGLRPKPGNGKKRRRKR